MKKMLMAAFCSLFLTSAFAKPTDLFEWELSSQNTYVRYALGGPGEKERTVTIHNRYMYSEDARLVVKYTNCKTTGSRENLSVGETMNFQTKADTYCVVEITLKPGRVGSSARGMVLLENPA